MNGFNELEQIIKEGIFEKDYVIMKHKVRMRTLTSGEVDEIMKSISGYDETSKYLSLEIKTIARAIVMIDGKRVDYVPQDKNEPITEAKKIQQNEEIVGKWQKTVLDLYYEKFSELRGEQNSFLSKSRTLSKQDGAESNGDSPEN